MIQANGLTILGGMALSEGGVSPPGPSGYDNVIGYDEMPPPVTPLGRLQDPSATINSPIGFTINNDTQTGVAIQGLTASNQAWFAANYLTVPGTYTCTWGPGSTVASSSITVIQIIGSIFVFTIQGQTGPATYNYPFTFS
jgi:hypothetical protein